MLAKMHRKIAINPPPPTPPAVRYSTRKLANILQPTVGRVGDNDYKGSSMKLLSYEIFKICQNSLIYKHFEATASEKVNWYHSDYS